MSDPTPLSGPEQQDAARAANKRFVGGLLMAVGAMLAGLCGLCTLFFFGIGIVSAVTPHLPEEGEVVAYIILAPVVGALPIAIGLVLFFVGRSISRQGLVPPKETWKEFE